MRLLDREYLQRIEERAVQDILRISLSVAEQMMDDRNLVYGDVEIHTPEEFVLFYTDLGRRGVLEHLAIVSPDLSERFARRFERDATSVLTEE